MEIHKYTFTIVANGFADGPSQALREYLQKNKAERVVEISHPLVLENKGIHEMVTYVGNKRFIKKTRFINMPPLTYIVDPFIPLRIPKDDVWFGFNNLSCIRGLLRKRIGRTDKVVYWAVDFVPGRFGKGLATFVYDKVDKFVSKRVDLRIDLSEAALVGRTKYLNVPADKLAPGMVVPMGAWLDRTPKVKKSSWKNKKIVYLGHLVERQGVALLIDAMKELANKGVKLELGIIGSGPLLDDLKKQVKTLGLSKNIKFHGFVKDHKDVEAILAGACVAVAPYVKDPESFTQYADPGKLKAYLGAYLPIVLTDVPPNARELEKDGVAVLVEDNAIAIAKGIEALIKDEAQWTKAWVSAQKVAKSFDWNNLIRDVFKRLDD
jgi:glycosyltransferase involved in cell wall biosynthesis